MNIKHHFNIGEGFNRTEKRERIHQTSRYLEGLNPCTTFFYFNLLFFSKKKRIHYSFLQLKHKFQTLTIYAYNVEKIREKSQGDPWFVKNSVSKIRLDFKNICRMGGAKNRYCKTSYNSNDHN